MVQAAETGELESDGEQQWGLPFTVVHQMTQKELKIKQGAAGQKVSSRSGKNIRKVKGAGQTVSSKLDNEKKLKSDKS